VKTSSCKAKGRALQKEVAAALLIVGAPYGLVADDIKSTAMGQSGVDVQLSPAAKKVFSDLAIECKRVEALNVVTTFEQHQAKYKDRRALLVHRRTRSKTLATVEFDFFLELLRTRVAKGQ